MTTKLKILIVGLVLSLIYAISDYIARNSDKPVVEVKREVKKRAKTARVDLNRIATIRAKSAKLAKLRERKSGIIPQADFNPIPDEILALKGWGRNPFIAVKEKPRDLLLKDPGIGGVSCCRLGLGSSPWAMTMGCCDASAQFANLIAQTVDLGI